MTAYMGKENTLEVIKDLEFGFILDGENLGDILLPTRYIPEGAGMGDMLDVFVYKDSEDRVIATTETPLVKVGECAYLKVTDVNYNGAFLDWGLPKELMVPYNEQATPMQKGKYYLITVYTDSIRNRIVGSSKLDKRLDKEEHSYKDKDKVALMIMSKTDLGYKVIVNHKHWGVLYKNEVFTPLGVGQTVAGVIRKVRADGKLDVQLPKVEKDSFADLETKILEKLQAHGGFLAIYDKSDPKIIAKVFGVSKKNYKKALGALYKQEKIVFVDNGVKLLKA